ncbi:MAG: hypothetical protein Q9170_004890 [Blastenia crenularia]
MDKQATVKLENEYLIVVMSNATVRVKLPTVPLNNGGDRVVRLQGEDPLPRVMDLDQRGGLRVMDEDGKELFNYQETGGNTAPELQAAAEIWEVSSGEIDEDGNELAAMVDTGRHISLEATARSVKINQEPRISRRQAELHDQVLNPDDSPRLDSSKRKRDTEVANDEFSTPVSRRRIQEVPLSNTTSKARLASERYITRPTPQNRTSPKQPNLVHGTPDSFPKDKAVNYQTRISPRETAERNRPARGASTAGSPTQRAGSSNVPEGLLSNSTSKDRVLSAAARGSSSASPLKSFLKFNSPDSKPGEQLLNTRYKGTAKIRPKSRQSASNRSSSPVSLRNDEAIDTQSENSPSKRTTETHKRQKKSYEEPSITKQNSQQHGKAKSHSKGNPTSEKYKNLRGGNAQVGAQETVAIFNSAVRRWKNVTLRTTREQKEEKAQIGAQESPPVNVIGSVRPETGTNKHEGKVRLGAQSSLQKLKAKLSGQQENERLQTNVSNKGWSSPTLKPKSSGTQATKVTPSFDLTKRNTLSQITIDDDHEGARPGAPASPILKRNVAGMKAIGISPTIDLTAENLRLRFTADPEADARFCPRKLLPLPISTLIPEPAGEKAEWGSPCVGRMKDSSSNPTDLWT